MPNLKRVRVNARAAAVLKRVRAANRLGNPKAAPLKNFPAAKTPAEFVELRRQMLILEHIRAIEGAEAARLLMGDKWVENVVRYHRQCLAQLVIGE